MLSQYRFYTFITQHKQFIMPEMYNLYPTLLCDRHLLKEHMDIHMFKRALDLKVDICQEIKEGKIETHNLIKRHNELMVEIEARGYIHNTPIGKGEYKEQGKVDKTKVVAYLAIFCEDCKKRLS